MISSEVSDTISSSQLIFFCVLLSYILFCTKKDAIEKLMSLRPGYFSSVSSFKWFSKLNYTGRNNWVQCER